MKKLLSKFIIGIIIIIIIIAITAIAILHSKNNILFKKSNTSAFGNYEDGYIIYKNGIIQKYYVKDGKYLKYTKYLEKAKITNEELSKLKELANTVEDKFEENTGFQRPSTEDRLEIKIYSDKLSKFVELYILGFGTFCGLNPTETANEILEFTGILYDKYL